MPDTSVGNPILTDLFRHNLWANLALIDFRENVSDEVLATNVPGTYGSTRETLSHLAGTEERYLGMLRGELAPDASPRDPDAAPDLVALRERALREGKQLTLTTIRNHARASGEGLIADAASSEGDALLRVAFAGQAHELSAALVLVQAINHATEHRTQIKTALTQAGIQPPEIDGWTWDAAR